MSYAVVWNEPATKVIEQAWELLDERRRADVREAISSVQVGLTTHPYEAGESRDSSEVRVAFFQPLIVHFQIEPDQTLVRVYAVAISPKP